MAFWESVAEGTFNGLLKGAGSFFKDVRTAITGKEPLSSEQQMEMIKQLDILEARMHEIELKGQQGQIDLNKLDAQSTSLFKSGWRPAIGWCCVIALLYSFLLRPLLPWTVEVAALALTDPITLPTMPALDMKEILGLVFTLLGMGGFRMYEKIKGVASK